MAYLGCKKFGSDVVDAAKFLRELELGNKKYPNSIWQLRTYEFSHGWGTATGIQICWYSKK